MKSDFIVVGAGLVGCVFAERIASDLKKTVLVIEKREDVGGNCIDFINEHGILVHKYGPHWFHTNSEKVFEYLSRFTEWRHHVHRVRTSIDGQLFPFPINMDTINKLYNLNLRSPDEVEGYFESVRVKDIKGLNAEEIIVSKVGWDVYNKFYKNYTTKQWGMDPTELDPSVTARIPIRYDRDDRYFTDKYQGLPKDGYHKLFSRMLDHPNITVITNTNYKAIIDSISYRTMIYTGPIDSFFDFKFGKLPYRSLQFSHETFDVNYFQDFQQVNYPNEFGFTRIVEWKHATGQVHSKTTITKEYPCSSVMNDEPLYPIPTRANYDLYKKYENESQAVKSCIFCGRLAEYKYFNMDQVVARALKLYAEKIAI